MSAPIPIALLIEATTGGTRRHIVDLATHLDRDRFSISVIASMRRDADFRDDVTRLRELGVTVHELDMVRSIAPVQDYRSYRRLCDHLVRHPCALLHTHSSKAGMLGRYAARRSSVAAVVHTPHVFPFQMRAPVVLRSLYGALERRAARHTRAIVCVSEAERKAALQRGLCEADKLHVISNGVAVHRAAGEAAENALRQELGLAEDARVVGVVGRLSEQKGLDLLVASARRLVDENTSLCFVLVGDGPQRENLWCQVEDLGLSAHFRFCGSRRDAPDFYGLFDILAIPSRWEGLPYTLLEGMAAGCAIVATRVGGMQEVLSHEHDGLLVTAEDESALGSAIGRLLDEPALADALGGNARHTVHDRYRLETMVEATSALYEQLLS